MHVPSVPWYRRWWQRVRRLVDRILRRPVPDAGAAVAGIGRKRHRRHVLTVNYIRVARSSLSLLVVVLMLAYAAVPPFRQAVNAQAAAGRTAVQRLFSPSFSPVHALTATASSQLADHPASAAVDGFKNTCWAAELGPDPQPTLLLTFAQPATIDAMLFTSGSPSNFASEPRPRQLHIALSNGASQDIHLADQAAPQQVDIDHGGGVTQLEIRVVSVYPSAQGNALSLTEVEMFTRN